MTCKIELYDKNIYRTGNTIYGKAFCQFYATEEFNDITCVLQGKEITSWTTRRNDKTYYHGGENTFLNQELLLCKRGRLPPGTYEYPFAFSIPSNMPNTFNGTYGSIRYFIVLTVNKGIVSNYTCEVTLIVLSIIDFNYIHEQLQLQPSFYQDEKSVCCCCCLRGNVTMELLLEKEAFTVGEKLNVTVKIANFSRNNILCLEVKLDQRVVYKDPNGYQIVKDAVIISSTDTGVGANGERTYVMELQIPPDLMLLNLAGASLISIYAAIIAEAVIPGFHSNLLIRTQEIKLGHIPLTDDPTKTSKALYPEIDPPPYSLNAKFETVNGYASSSFASAPKEEESASAPPKEALADKDAESFDVIQENQSLLPSYEDTEKGSSTHT